MILIANVAILKFIHEKDDFAEISKILIYRDLKIILLDHQNNYIRNT